jgi:hypothetical protein
MRYRRVVASTPTPASQRVKRLTLDLPSEVHRALKVRSAELDVPMAELLRELIHGALAEPSVLIELADRCRDNAGLERRP